MGYGMMYIDVPMNMIYPYKFLSIIDELLGIAQQQNSITRERHDEHDDFDLVIFATGNPTTCLHFFVQTAKLLNRSGFVRERDHHHQQQQQHPSPPPPPPPHHHHHHHHYFHLHLHIQTHLYHHYHHHDHHHDYHHYHHYHHHDHVLITARFFVNNTAKIIPPVAYLVNKTLS